MNITTLAKRLKMSPEELCKKITEYGFKLRKTTKKISDRKAKQIIKKIERERKKRQEKEKLEKEAIKKPKEILIPQNITVGDFAEKIGKSVSEVISELMKNGIIATINEEIDFETATIIASDLGVKKIAKKKEEIDIIREKGIRKKLLEEFAKEDQEKLKPKPPVCVVLGHIDHGKSKLLEALRGIHILDTEAGGITQHIGAYQVKHKGKLITFLDTPGHEAFKAMRERGAKVTDIAILVVAADDGVMPQTEEAIAHAKNAEIPIIVAINKIDKPEADPEKVKKQLADLGLTPEEWGGETICVEISAKQKINLSELLEMILLTAELEDLKANPNARAVGTIIESHMDPKKGPIASVLVQNGTLRLNDSVTVGNILGTIRALQNFQGKKINHAKPSTPVQILGLEAVPKVGDILQVEESREKARAKIARLKKIGFVPKIQKNEEKNVKKLNLLLVADVQGSLEAILSELAKIKAKEVQVSVIKYSLGKITESDVMTAAAASADILGFNTSITPVAKRLAEDRKVKYQIYNIIYKLLDDVKKKLSDILEPEIIKTFLGKLEVLAIFRIEKGRMIVGGKVLGGRLKKEAKIRVWRNQEEIGQGKIANLQINKVDVEEVGQGKECGLVFIGPVKIKEGDILEAWEEKFVKKEI